MAHTKRPYKKKTEEIYSCPGSSEFYQGGYGASQGKLVLTAPQKNVLNSLLSEKEQKPVLLHGVTCSGKTEIYLQYVEKILKQGKTALILVPEISLTPQMGQRFITRFGSIVAFIHSGLTSRERYDQWQLIFQQKVKIVIGARSAIFTPLKNLGCIIVDEEGEGSYKQDSQPRYHAREVAYFLSRLSGSRLILGSATPGLETYFQAVNGNYLLLQLNESVFGKKNTRVHLVDMTEEFRIRFNKSIFSRRLIQSIDENLANKRQALLFLNKRGYSTFVLCRECGYKATCRNCQVSLCWHRDSNRLICHYCSFKTQVPDICPECSSTKIRHFGAGTQRVEEEVRKRWPDARLIRMDSDRVRTRKEHEQMLSMIERSEVDILIGTQMIAKGLDFPNIGLVGVISADILLNLPDFRANERSFALLDQVVGRSGRGDFESKVVIQTYHPDHYSLLLGMKQKYREFFEKEIKFRKDLFYPPYSKLVQIKLSGRNEEEVKKFADNTRQIIEIIVKELNISDEIQLFGPAPSPIGYIRKDFRFSLLLKCSSHKVLQDLLQEFSKNVKPKSHLNYTIDVNPYDFF
ncbi:primosomal protein N' [Candidatus Riflebacteria bacterium]